jgi:hypothetical protein
VKGKLRAVKRIPLSDILTKNYTLSLREGFRDLALAVILGGHLKRKSMAVISMEREFNVIMMD